VDEDAHDEKQDEESSDTALNSSSHLATAAVSIVGSPPNHAYIRRDVAGLLLD
jgi:hypothetical protein